MSGIDLLREVIAPEVLRKHRQGSDGCCTKCVTNWGMEETEPWPCDAAKLALALLPPAERPTSDRTRYESHAWGGDDEDECVACGVTWQDCEGACESAMAEVHSTERQSGDDLATYAKARYSELPGYPEGGWLQPGPRS